MTITVFIFSLKITRSLSKVARVIQDLPHITENHYNPKTTKYICVICQPGGPKRNNIVVEVLNTARDRRLREDHTQYPGNNFSLCRPTWEDK